jgi:hypothetical protein
MLDDTTTRRTRRTNWLASCRRAVAIVVFAVGAFNGLV